MKIIAYFLVMTLLLTLVVAEAEVFGYDNPSLPILGTGSNISIVTVNNSIFWNGYAFSLTRWLDIDGGNANQNINVAPYNITAGAFIGDGSQLTNLPSAVYPHDQNLNTTDNVSFVNLNITNHIEALTMNISNITTRNINVTENSTIWLGGIPISSSFNFEGKRVVSFGNASDEDVFIDAFAYLGSGFYLENISFENGTVIASAFNGSLFTGGNFTGSNFTGTNAFFDFYDWTAETPWLIFNGSYLSFNESYFNQSVQNLIDNSITTALNNLTFDNITLNGSTIYDWSAVNYTVSNGTVTYTTPSFSGTSNFVVPENFNFEIAQIIVDPSVSTGSYRFAMYEVGSGETIDADLINHKGQWNIFKSYPIDGQVSLNFTNVAPSNSFTITIKYFTNVAN